MKTRSQFKLLCLVCLFALPGLVFSPVSGQITPPEDHLGFKPGADFHLANYEQAMSYFELLDSQTDRMQMFDMGPTSEGKRMMYAVISSEANMARLDRYKEISRRLSLVRGVSEDEARSLADEGKAIVWIDGGLHASEVAPAQHHIQLAYDMVTGEDRQTRFIRDNVILLLVFANPDGMSIIANWYMDNVGTPYETAGVPELYHKYAGHDNNRDSFIANLIETRNMNRATSLEWFPEILYNQHQTAPFPARIWIPPESEPTNPNIHPIIVRWKNLIGAAMGKAFEEANQPGAISRISFDSWFPGYVTQIVDGHNIPSILTETALFRYATPNFYTLNDFPEAHRDLTVDTFYPSPGEGGWWRLGDAVAYNLTASRAVMEVAAKYRYEFLYNKWVVGNDVIEKFKNEPPYGWIIPTDQRDANTTSLMLERLALMGTEIYMADAAFVHDGISYKKDSFIIPASQPFGLFVKNILEKQSYPDLRKYPHLWQGLVSTFTVDGPPLRPYDGVGWTLPSQMGVEIREMSKNLEVATTIVEEVPYPVGQLIGSGSQYVFSHADNNSFKALNNILKAGGSVSWANNSFNLRGNSYPAGTFIVDSRSIPENTLRTIAQDSHIPMHGGSVRVDSTPLSSTKIGLYKSWSANMDAGWSTLIFEQYDFDYQLVGDSEMKAGDLIDRYDVIILPDQNANSIINGRQKGTIHPDYIGGITQAGVENLKKFVEAGGVLICNKSSADLAISQFDLPLKNVLQGVPSDSFNTPGSILKMTYDTSHPIAYGMEEEGIAFFSRGRVYEIIEDEEDDEEGEEGENNDKPQPVVVGKYPEESLLVSGWILGEERIQGKAGVVEVSVGEGKVILFGFNVQNRAQAFATFKLLFNAIYNH